MAKVTTITLTDDLDQNVEADETVNFALDGKSYEIDLSDEHAGELRDALAPFVAAARSAGGGGRKPGKPGKPDRDNQDGGVSKEEGAAIRTWVREHGGEIADRGRIPRKYVEAYRNGKDESVFADNDSDAGGETDNEGDENAKARHAADDSGDESSELVGAGSGVGDPFDSGPHF